MFSEQLKRVLNLVKKTGDRVVVFDASEANDSYVIMDISAYEKMILSEAPIKDNILNISQENNKDLSENKEIVAPVVNIENEVPKDLTEEDLTDKINREISMWKNQENPSFLSDEDKAKKPWAIPSQVKKKAQDVE